MVGGSTVQRTGRTLQRVLERQAFAACATVNPVRGLCGVAKKVVARRCTRNSTLVLEKPAQRRNGHSRSADRSSSCFTKSVSRRLQSSNSFERSHRPADRAEQTRRRYSVYDLAGRVSDSAVAVLQPGWHRGWVSNRRTQPCRDRRSDRLLY